jgi:hypothetical protein
VLCVLGVLYSLVLRCAGCVYVQCMSMKSGDVMCCVVLVASPRCISGVSACVGGLLYSILKESRAVRLDRMRSDAVEWNGMTWDGKGDER